MKNGAVVVTWLIGLLWGALPGPVAANERDFTLSAPPEIVETGFLKHLLPRFSLKHGVRITLADQGGDAVIGTEGTPVFAGLGTVWHLSYQGGDGPALFADWLASDIGTRTIAAFKPDGTPLFSTEIAVRAAAVTLQFDGDAATGETLSLYHCGRCHVVNDTNRMKGMGQTPSFGLMRTFEDWENRFSGFYALNPHPSFSQVEGITPPFDIERPPAIVPLAITQTELEDILAYVATIPPADLGAPLQNQ